MKRLLSAWISVPWFRLGMVMGVALPGCSSNDDRLPMAGPVGGIVNGAAVPRDRLPEPTEAFREQRCRYRVPGYASQCGFVTVSAGVGAARPLEIEVLRIFSSDRQPAPDPIVYLDGGPGSPGILTVVSLLEEFEPFLQSRDLVVIDQRGTGRSGDSLACPAAYAAATDEDFLEGLAGCAARLEREEVSLSSYTTPPSASDVDAVRRALGYPEWNLFGISYGTRLGLTVLRDHPEGVRSAVLDSVVPLQVDLIGQLAQNGYAAFEAVFAACMDQASCRFRYPNSMQQLLAVVPRLNETPLSFGDALSMKGDDLLNLLFQFMYHPLSLGLVPLLIDEADRGEVELFELLSDFLGGSGPDGGDEGFSLGLHLSVQCAEEVPFTSPEALSSAERDVPEVLLGGLSGAYYFDYCSAWQVPPALPRENEPVHSTVPTLLMAGGFDPITPPAYAELVHHDLENSLFVTMQNLSHGAGMDSCGASLVMQFFDEPAAPLGQSCVAQVPSPEFFSVGGGRQHQWIWSGPEVSFAVEDPTNDELAAVEQALRHRAPWPRRRMRRSYP